MAARGASPKAVDVARAGVPLRRVASAIIALEPIVSVSATRSRLLRDRWTVVSTDGSLTAHHEYTIVIRRGRPLVLTAA